MPAISPDSTVKFPGVFASTVFYFHAVSKISAGSSSGVFDLKPIVAYAQAYPFNEKTPKKTLHL
jgi:hypothetical protein